MIVCFQYKCVRDDGSAYTRFYSGRYRSFAGDWFAFGGYEFIPICAWKIKQLK